jgi:hypothetical protein
MQRHITLRIHQTPSRRSAPARAQVMRVVMLISVAPIVQTTQAELV